ncbi:MAG TPA: DUF1648 domain-containing protein [Casimicrobiaceae bacterium]|nr:DUF1648 domain-containing protein [Casimicrobiaceae bacterium]
MRRSVFPVFLAALVVAAAFIAATSSALPARVASHFARGGEANGWMTRESYGAFILGAALGSPLLVATLVARLPRAFPGAVNLPNRAHWFAPERREATLASLATFGWCFGAALALLIAGVHWTVVAANARTPPRLENGAIAALLAAFALALGIWLLAWYLRFRRPR